MGNREAGENISPETETYGAFSRFLRGDDRSSARRGILRSIPGKRPVSDKSELRGGAFKMTGTCVLRRFGGSIAVRAVDLLCWTMLSSRLLRPLCSLADWWSFQVGTIEGWFDRTPESPEDGAIREEGERLRKAFPSIDFDHPGARTIPPAPKDQ
jgi:hypothetical protein